MIGHWTHLATLVLVGPCWLGPNCFGPLFLQLCLSFDTTANPASLAVSNVPMFRCCPLREPGGL